jgi:putative hydrolase of the HAD superfamily
MTSTLTDIVRGKRAVIFDLFHTLTAPERSWGDYLPRTADMLGVGRIAWRDQLLLHSHGRLVGAKTDPVEIIRELARAIDPTITEETIRATTDNRIKRFEQTVVDIPEESLATLDALKAQGKSLGLISNADVMEVAAWDKSPLASRFDVAIFSCEVRVAKPDPEIYAIALARLGVTPADVVYVGDGGSDELKSARALGMTTVMMKGVIKHLWPDKVLRGRPHADFIVDDLTELVTKP